MANVNVHSRECDIEGDNFRMNTGYGRYGAAYNMVGFTLL
jgi:hypothetical protein